ncbi:MAG: PHB depolymerase family esterase [Myxococcota bacterium]|nr:PHB depolymerase family esterase [Myxococcota bacterium]
MNPIVMDVKCCDTRQGRLLTMLWVGALGFSGAVGCETTDEPPLLAEQTSPAEEAQWATGTIPEGPLGGERPADFVLPSHYDPGQEWPLIVLIHGYGVAAWIQDIYLNLTAQADALGAVILLPNGTENSEGMPYWNASDACCDFEESDVDDVGYLMGLIAEARDVFHIDPSRVLLVGHSNGGYMAHVLACGSSDVITGILSLSAPMPLLAQDCEPDHPVTIVQAHGTEDKTVHYDGVEETYPSAEETFERWSALNGCSGEPVVVGPVDYDEDIAGPESTVLTHDACDGGVGVQFLSMEGTAHIPIFDERFIRDTVGFLIDRPR